MEATFLKMMRRSSRISSTARRAATVWLQVLAVPYCSSRGLSNSDYQIESSRILFDSYRRVRGEKVVYPTGLAVHFEVMETEPAIFCLPYCTKNKTFTLVQEYHPGSQEVTLGLVAGQIESKKHNSIQDCVRDELSEEAGLVANEIIPLTERGLPIDKYTRGTFHPFLALDCTPDPNPKPMDAEELIHVLQDVKLSQLRSYIYSGQFNVPSTAVALLALDKLQALGLLEEDTE